MRTFKLRPRTPEQIASRDAVLEALLARERVNRAILDSGHASDATQDAVAAYKASRRSATKALRVAAVTVAPQRQGAIRGPTGDHQRG